MWSISGRGVPMTGCLIRKGQAPRSSRPDIRPRGPIAGTGEPRPLRPDDCVRRIRIGRPGELRDAAFLAEFRDRSIALDFVRRLRGDAAEMAMLRSLLSTAVDTGPVHRLGDHEVLDRLAGCLVFRRVVVAVDLSESRAGVSSPPRSGHEIQCQRAMPKPPQPRERVQRPSSAARPTEIRAPGASAGLPASTRSAARAAPAATAIRPRSAHPGP